MYYTAGQSCMQRIQDGRPVLSCDVNSDSQLLAHSLQIDITLSLQMLLKNVESQVSWYEVFSVQFVRYPLEN
jgi:hypothetical protein